MASGKGEDINMKQEQVNVALQADPGAPAILRAFNTYLMEFKRITNKSQGRFENQDWHGAQKDALERLELYTLIIDKTVADLKIILGEATKNKSIWNGMKKAYSDLIKDRSDFELAETFFNSVTRRIFATVGVDPSMEYVDSDFEALRVGTGKPVHKTFYRSSTTADLITDLLIDYQFNVAYRSLYRDAKLVADEIDARLRAHWGSPEIDGLEVVKSIFYRHKAAYIVGRIRKGEQLMPFVLPLLVGDDGIFVDTILLTEDDVSIVFSFTRSYFHVESETPYELVVFLKSIMPLKRLAELYISIGYNKHGKTELYRELLRHLRSSDDKFEIARGDKGMVMVVFTLRSYDMVFKIIKDRFSYPKTTTRQDVMDKYLLVFKHDRVGRLVDAQEFEHLSFDRTRFSEALLEELQQEVAGTVTIAGERVIIKHLYAERRMIPLNLYLRDADKSAAWNAILDYGDSVKELAATNIFPGDLLLKNFGVTRHGRVVFYDYDELCLLTDCNFRTIPPPRDFDDDVQAEPWFYVGQNDIFPEEFIKFLGLQGTLRRAFEDVHGDLLGVVFWATMQERIKAGEVIDLFPYQQSKRFPRPT